MARRSSAVRDWTRRLIGVAVAYAVAIQTILAAVAIGQSAAAAAAASDDPFVICLGTDGASVPSPSQHPLHHAPCVVHCAAAMAAAALLPAPEIVVAPLNGGAAIQAAPYAECDTARHPTPRMSQGPPAHA